MRQETVDLVRTKEVDGITVTMSARKIPNNPDSISKAEEQLLIALDKYNVKDIGVDKERKIKFRRIGKICFFLMKNHQFNSSNIVVGGIGFNIPHNKDGGNFGFHRVTWQHLLVLSTNTAAVTVRWKPLRTSS